MLFHITVKAFNYSLLFGWASVEFPRCAANQASPAAARPFSVLPVRKIALFAHRHPFSVPPVRRIALFAHCHPFSVLPVRKTALFAHGYQQVTANPSAEMDFPIIHDGI